MDGGEFGVIGDGVPPGSAAAVFPPFARPALRSDPRRLVVVDAGLARHRPESPELLAGLGVIRRHIAADRSHIRAAMANDHLAVEHPRRARDEPNIVLRSEEHTSELQSLMRIPYAVFCLKKKKKNSQS